MPTYVYKCKRCGHDFEQFQKITAPARARCPVCQGPAERVITGGGGFVLKGGGFYATDYRSESYKKAAKTESGEVAPPKKGDDATEPTAGKKPDQVRGPKDGGQDRKPKKPED